MKFLEKLSLKAKLIISFILAALIPIISISYIEIQNNSDTVITDKANMLEQVLHIKRDNLVDAIKEKFNDLILLSHSSDANKFVVSLENLHVKNNTTAKDINPENPDLQKLVIEGDKFFPKAAEIWGYKDIYVLCAKHGHIVYTVNKGSEFGKNINNGNTASSSLAEVWQKVVDTKKQAFADFKYYEPDNTPAAFIAIPVNNSEGELVAVFALQIENREISRMVQLNSTESKSEEVYLVGEDKLMRSNSRFSTESTVMKEKVDNKAVEMALNGEDGFLIVEDYRGVNALSVFHTVELKEDIFLGADFNWIILAEIDEDELTEEISSVILRIIFTALIILLVVSIFAFFLSNYISKPISKIVEGANVLVSSTSQITATISELTASSNQTVSAVNETSITVDEVKQTAQAARENAEDVTRSSEQAISDSIEGEAAVNETSSKMSKIKSQMSVIAESITELSEQGSSIGDIMNSINDLAEQSNLLAVNAAIEAAKAGEKGKGFAVVANEVRSLAEQSKQATQQVRTILNEIQKAASKSVMATEEGTKAVNTGVEQVELALEKIQILAKTIEDSSRSALQIAASSKEQFAGIDQINTAVKNIYEGTTQNLTSAQQLNDAAQNLKKLSEDLKSVIQFYQ